MKVTLKTSWRAMVHRDDVIVIIHYVDVRAPLSPRHDKTTVSRSPKGPSSQTNTYLVSPLAR